MSGLDALYLRSPLWLQSASVAAYGWWWHRRRFSTHFRRLVRELTDHERWTPVQMQEYQDLRLAEVLGVAVQSPYYRPLLEQAGLSPATPPRDVLARLPLLSKEQLRIVSRSLLTGRPPRGTVTFKSSGTKGRQPKSSTRVSSTRLKWLSSRRETSSGPVRPFAIDG